MTHYHDHDCDCGCGHEHDHYHEEDFSSQDKYHEALSQYDTELSDDHVKAQVARLLEHIGENDTHDVRKTLLGCLDLTTLKCTDSEESVLRFVEKVNALDEEHPDLPHVAALCVYPCFAGIVSESLQVEGVEVACVSGGFPSSQTFMEVKIAETSLALHEGATEIDVVIPVGKFLSGDYEGMCDELQELKALCAERPLKVILETGALGTAANIKRAALLTMYSGADFIKTSTGKEPVSATPEAAIVMCQAIKEYYAKTGRRIGFKAAGGINTVQDALTYYTIVKELLGEEWLSPALFRIGTSRLVNLLLTEILGEEVKMF
ncbi:MAG: deoxyribose-phosphate aldolase [Bacteroidaceae bacterium]|nr:deoxyribose-phosphate aldolase [Bacteroidaceae bacterium]